MKTLIDHLAQYATYHRDPRNISTHFVGVPMIVLAVVILLSRPAWGGTAVVLSPALLLVLAACVFYVRLDLRLGACMVLLLALALALGQWVALQSTAVWLWAGVGLFVLGWAIQFIGHYYEGKKPAFMDDLFGLVVAPLFLLAEAAFGLGLRLSLQQAVEARVGPVRLRDLTPAA